MVYDRTRRGVGQKFAVRTDGTAIGRVADSRYGISSCDQEAKYPLGVWRQGETRDFQYQCWYGSGAGKRAARSVTRPAEATPNGCKVRGRRRKSAGIVPAGCTRSINPSVRR